MWTKSNSATLSLACTRVLIFAVVAIAVSLPFLLTGGFYGSHADGGVLYEYMPAETVRAVFICAYICFAPTMVALFSLDKLLTNIRKEIVFDRANVKGLRIISWCCFIIAIVMLCGWPFISFVLAFVAAAAAFFGILMRVVKNVIDAACEIKAENDFTV
ncbi:MAG: DUF2975 domain-containing protein [Clostridiales Family XIII bacterium]|jgi:hypothetical protein|nr:DUF2975 domain-containing protein [Clostridiales Family XIII bacterium]